MEPAEPVGSLPLPSLDLVEGPAVDPALCRCPCHEGGAGHKGLCCATCPSCGLGVRVGRFRDHLRQCQDVVRRLQGVGPP